MILVRKSTVADFFAGHPLCYVSDNFTPAAFVSHHAATVPRTGLYDELPTVFPKVLAKPALSAIEIVSGKPRWVQVWADPRCPPNRPGEGSSVTLSGRASFSAS
jgi:hypothetical protein